MRSIPGIFFLVLVCLVMLTACATGDVAPVGDYQSRAVSHSDGGVRVTASVLSDEESQQLYGVSLAGKEMQPVWVQIENHDDIAYWLLPVGLDPDFFPATEAVEAFANEAKPSSYRALEQRFADLSFRNPVPAGATVTGYVLVNRDQGVKMIQLDLAGNGRFKSFSMLAGIPGFHSDYKERKVFSERIYTEEEILNYTDEASFRAALAALPCCATNKSGSRNGDPLNLIVVGGLDDAFPALIRRGWRPTEQTYIGSVTKMIKSALASERYRYAPVSPLYLYNRPQDLALQKARDNIHQRNHLRLWLSPIQFLGKPVWVGQISRDIGTRLTIHSPYLTTHKIDPDVDEARTALQEDMAYSQFLAKIGLVKGVGAAPRDKPRENLTRDPYFSDGFRTVLVFDSAPTALTGIQFFDWEGHADGFIEKSVERETK